MSMIATKTRNILIVDDDEFSIFLCETLFSRNFNITGVSNGYDALKILEEQKFDVVLMDINLGDMSMDGIRTMRMIRHNKKHNNLKIFAITAFSNDRNLYINQGFDDMFVKPLLEETLIEKISNAIEKRMPAYSKIILN